MCAICINKYFGNIIVICDVKSVTEILIKIYSLKIIFKYVCMFLCRAERGLINS